MKFQASCRVTGSLDTGGRGHGLAAWAGPSLCALKTSHHKKRVTEKTVRPVNSALGTLTGDGDCPGDKQGRDGPVQPHVPKAAPALEHKWV